MECPVVKIEAGLVKGKVSKANHASAKPVFNFLAIPYGKPPVGELRFIAPQKAEPWVEILDATTTYGACPQDVSVAAVYDTFIPYKNSLQHDFSNITEDCLNLNIFTSSCDRKKKLPVMVYVTGGRYQRHYGGRTDGTALSGMNDVVVVVPNFRVNAFGFLSFGPNSCCPGNAAILDVLLALEWVKENISEFGGDPNNVTIFGESSGSGMVHSVMLSPLSKGLVHKAVLMSGTLLSPLFHSESGAPARDTFLQTLGIDWKKENEKDILKTLQRLPAEEIMRGQKNFNELALFGPTTDNHVLTDSPAKLTQSGQVQAVPLLIGCTNSEGAGILSFHSCPDYLTGAKEEAVMASFSSLFATIHPSADAATGFEMLKKFYKTEENPRDPMRYSQLYADLMSDTVFVVPTVLTATAHAAMGNPTFLYQITHQPEFNHSEVNGPDLKNKPEFCECDHADDLLFFFGMPFIDGQLTRGAYFTEDEYELSKKVMRYFTNFARSGDPNSPSEAEVMWPSYSVSENREHAVLQLPLKVGKNLGLEKVVFYTQQLPRAGML